MDIQNYMDELVEKIFYLCKDIRTVYNLYKPGH